MKWIGQHIWDFISRFRNDIYLEGISSGTIASGKHLGLDSDNKIVSSSISNPPDLTVSGAGTIHTSNVPTLNQNTTGNAATASIAATATTATTAKGVQGPTDADVTVSSDGDVNIVIDSDGDELSSLVLFKARAVEIGRIDELGNATFPGVITGKQRHAFVQNFVDDINEDKLYLPFKTSNEQTTRYQDEAAMLMPCDGKIVSVTIRVATLNSGSGDLTVGVEVGAMGVSVANAWNVVETETLPVSSSDDNHVFHFTFDNAKHFDSTDLVAISIQAENDLQTTNQFWWATTVVEYDYNSFLGTTSSEYTTTP